MVLGVAAVGGVTVMLAHGAPSEVNSARGFTLTQVDVDDLINALQLNVANTPNILLSCLDALVFIYKQK